MPRLYAFALTASVIQVDIAKNLVQAVCREWMVNVVNGCGQIRLKDNQCL